MNPGEENGNGGWLEYDLSFDANEVFRLSIIREAGEIIVYKNGLLIGSGEYLNANISKCYGSLLVFDEILKDNSKITYEKLTFYKFEDYVKHKLNKSFNKEKYIQEGIERAERLLKIKNNKYKYIDSLILGCRQTFKAAKWKNLILWLNR